MTGAATYQPKRTSPVALGVVILMHGVAIGALALAKMEVFTKTIVDTETYNVPLEPPPKPPEPVDKPKPRVEPRQQDTVIDKPPPIVDFDTQGPTTEWKPIDTPRIVIPEPGPILVERDPPPPPPPPAARKVEPARAKANLGSYVSDADYPPAAVRNEEQGTTRFRLAVTPDGRVAECTVTGSSGSSSLDAATCRLMKQRARFSPARDSEGKPTGDSVSSSIRWHLPDE